MEKEMTVRELASIGGRSRARKLSKERLSQIGRKAVRARWAKYYAKQQHSKDNAVSVAKDKKSKRNK
jgi:hypothetical protein